MTIPTSNPYIYEGYVLKVVDGDTIDVSIDLGFKVSIKRRLRLHGINAPETRGAERADGLVSKKWLMNRLTTQQIVIDSMKDKTGKYGRWLARIYHKGECINELMVSEGLAVAADY